MTDEKQKYIDDINKSALQAKEALKKNPRLDYSDLFSTFLNLKQSSMDRLLAGLRRIKSTSRNNEN